jgi:hypothetical protein
MVRSTAAWKVRILPIGYETVVECGRSGMRYLEWLSEKVVSGTTAVLKNPLLLVGLMVVSLLVKRFAAPGDEGSKR